MDKIIYNSINSKETKTIKAPYYNAINPTEVHFEQEKIVVTMNSLGHIEFYDEHEKSLGFVDFPVSDDPSEYAHTAQYGEIECLVDDNTIIVLLPVYTWFDSYPNCDGESDRWTRRIKRWFKVVFDCTNHTISIIDK